MKLFKGAQAVLALSILSLAASAAATTTYSGSFGGTVPDNDPLGTTSTITIADAGIVTSLTVDVVIDHTWLGDLTMTLTSAAGTTITLMDRPGYVDSGFGTNQDISGITFDDAAALAAEDVIGGPGVIALEVSPDDMLSTFAGESLAGDWTLLISDSAGGDPNTVAPTWSLNVRAAPIPVPAAVWLMLSALGALRLMRRS